MSFSNGIEEFQLDIKIKENDKVIQERRKTKNLRLIIVDNKPCIQLKRKNGIIKEIDISKIAGVFLSKNSEGKCFKLIFPDKIMIFLQSDNQSHYFAFLKKLIDEVDRNYKREPLPAIKKIRSQSVILDKKTNQRMLVKSVSLSSNGFMDGLFNRYYPVPEIDLNVNPLNENHQFTNDPQDFNVSYIYKLRSEIDHSGGIKLNLSEKGSGKYTFTMMNNYLWVSDTAYPDKTKKELHFGDRIVSVNGNKIKDIFHFQELLKHENVLTLIIQRLPKARVFLMVGTYENVKIKKNEKEFIIDEADSSWQITEINKENLLDSSENKGKMVKSLIQSNTILGVVLHEKTFIKSLREQNKTRRNSIKV